MTSDRQQEIILYDLACVKHVCFSPVVWRIRLMLNYKRIPYKTVFLHFTDIEPKLRSLGIVPDENAAGRYTVPAIHYLPTDKYIMDSTAISAFLESTYPDPAVPLQSELGDRVSIEARKLGKLLYSLITPREIKILSPDDQVYFRRTREASLGRPLEILLENEEQVWTSMQDGLRTLNELILTNKADGPFLLGAKPSYTDFFLAGSLRTAKVIDEGVFAKILEQPGLHQVYTACLPLMEKET